MPNLFIDFPADDAEVTVPSIDVAGRVGDVLSGFMGLKVMVNGNNAEVDVGIGNNGTFIVQNVPLTAGQSTAITATATDELGNSITKQINVRRVAIPPDAPRMVAVSGNGQTAMARGLLPNPLIVKITHGDGSPFVGKVVTFNVTRSNGRLTTDGLGEGNMTLQTRTDGDGVARAVLRLGGDAGCGNNRVEVTSTDIAGTVLFCASATAGVPKQINIGGGNNQIAEAGAKAPEPLVVWVIDSFNGVAGVPVTFTVTSGGGKVNGLDNVTVPTGRTGHAEVQFTLGPGRGNNVLEATYPGNDRNRSLQRSGISEQLSTYLAWVWRERTSTMRVRNSPRPKFNSIRHLRIPANRGKPLLEL